ncbi:ATP-binding cassette domain-containing protein [Arthrobacter sp. CAU 1506]|uniref:ABC transporter ATP-binding protein n=1 Tax=Arthrobacter sp. CAU 1506 TaxID=2560052 RepID=UPI0010AD7853|nr:ABC transporter ATP-binding protein [Arthrobacter sp. CAU 1506]TJY64143.1 ATP-binding cassette domain-containing protein [Arthrobacter sp. CAU 1506]
MPAEPALQLTDVSVEFPRRDSAVLRGVTLRLDPGEHLIVFGASGSGKSTLLQAITGVVPHTVLSTLTGSVSVNGTSTIDASVVELSRHIGVLSQDPSSGVCLPDVEQELALPLENRAVPPEQISARIDHALAAVGAAGLRQRQTDRLSGGEGQRVALAASLIAEPALLLLDEPTSMLDPAGLTAVRQAIDAATAAFGPSVVLVEHRLDDYAGPAGIAGLPERAVVLGDDGRVLADGDTAAVLAGSAGQLNARGCWLPLETELLAVTGRPGGLATPEVRAALRALALPREGDDLQAPRGLGMPNDDGASPAPRIGDTVLTARNVCVSRGAELKKRRRPRRTAETAPAILKHVNFELRRGEITALLGANGTGKTSLLLTLAGLLPPAEGSVAGARPGMVFQNPEHQFVAHSVVDEVRHGLPGDAGRLVKTVLDQHRLIHLADQSPFRLSGGEKRRLSVAAMLAHDRPSLLADEPTFGLDRRDTIATAAAFRQAAAAGRAIFFSSHDLRTVATLADRAVVVAEHTVIADGAIFDVLRDPDVLMRAGLRLPPLLDWLLAEFDSAPDIRRVLNGLDAAVSGATTAPQLSGSRV